MATLAIMKKRDELEGIVAASDNKFTGSVREPGVSAFETGDEFKIPEDFKVYNQPIGGNTVQFIYVEVGPNKVAKRFYPYIMWRSRSICNENKMLTGEVMRSSGTAVDEFRKYGSVQDAMTALKGKTLKITKMQPVRTLRYNTTDLITDHVPVIDLVENGNNA
jgi:hypothetical protein